MKASRLIRILVVEDDAHIAEGLKLNLNMQGYDVQIATDGIRAIEQWKAYAPHIIVLDIMLPGIDGFSVLQSIRLEDEKIPILILSAKATVEDKVQGLSYGVDDYLSKPFNLEEFLLRIKRLLKRSGWSRRSERQALVDEDIPDRYTFGDNTIFFQTGVAQGQSGEISLTEQEIKLLKLFIRNKNKPLSRNTILEIGWGYSGGMSTRTVDNFIVRLRKYFETNPKEPRFFKSVRSVGYLFQPPEQSRE